MRVVTKPPIQHRLQLIKKKKSVVEFFWPFLPQKCIKTTKMGCDNFHARSACDTDVEESTHSPKDFIDNDFLFLFLYFYLSISI